jgi:molybdopterin-binding protein
MRGVVALLICALSVAEAQLPSLTTGMRVRVNARDGIEITGTVTTQTADSITVEGSDAVAASSVTRVRVSQGKSFGGGALRGARKGGLIGLGVGAFLGLVLADFDSSPDLEERARFFAGVTGLVGAEGIVLGGLIGMAVRAERWSTVYRSPPKVAVGLDAHGRPAAALAMRF